MISYCIGTLQSKLKQGTPADARSGPPPILSEDEEAMLVDWVKHMSYIGYGRTREQLTLTVKSILDKDKRPNPFVDNRPGRKWVKGFMSRHPSLSLRKSQGLSISRALSCTPKVLDEWFDEFRNF